MNTDGPWVFSWGRWLALVISAMLVAGATSMLLIGTSGSEGIHTTRVHEGGTLSLPTRPLGTSGMEITTVGFGAWAIGGGGWRYGWGAQNDEESITSIRHAIESGINWIDTAAIYGLGHSEEIVAGALDGVPAPDRPYVFTKVGILPDPADPMGPTRRVMNTASVRREVDASLRRLRVERIDLYQVHRPPEDGTPLEAYWEVMAGLKAEGKVRAIGLSNHDAAQLEQAEKIAHVDSLQPPFSAINRSAASEIARAAAHGTGVIVYSPMQSGLLTGAFSRERVAGLPADDWRRGHPDFTTGLDANLALADALARVGERHGVPAAAIAAAWTLAWPGVTGAIVGARRPGQVDDWLPAASVRLADGDLDEIAAAIERTGAGSGPVRPG
jgi:aryl-alcohol dehydrogenase-like predicted oxidoreductase